MPPNPPKQNDNLDILDAWMHATNDLKKCHAHECAVAAAAADLQRKDTQTKILKLIAKHKAGKMTMVEFKQNSELLVKELEGTPTTKAIMKCTQDSCSTQARALYNVFRTMLESHTDANIRKKGESLKKILAKEPLQLKKIVALMRTASDAMRLKATRV